MNRNHYGPGDQFNCNLQMAYFDRLVEPSSSFVISKSHASDFEEASDDILGRLEQSGRVPSKEKFRRMACNTFIFCGACPYNDRCVFLHDYRLKAEGVKVKTTRQVKPSSSLIKDTFYWPDMNRNEVYQHVDSQGLADVNQRYQIPDSFGNVGANIHNRSLYSLWAHFVAFCMFNKSLKTNVFNNLSFEPFFQNSSSKENRYIKGLARLPELYRLSNALNIDTHNIELLSAEYDDQDTFSTPVKRHETNAVSGGSRGNDDESTPKYHFVTPIIGNSAWSVVGTPGTQTAPYMQRRDLQVTRNIAAFPEPLSEGRVLFSAEEVSPTQVHAKVRDLPSGIPLLEKDVPDIMDMVQEGELLAQEDEEMESGTQLEELLTPEWAKEQHGDDDHNPGNPLQPLDSVDLSVLTWNSVNSSVQPVGTSKLNSNDFFSPYVDVTIPGACDSAMQRHLVSPPKQNEALARQQVQSLFSPPGSSDTTICNSAFRNPTSAPFELAPEGFSDEVGFAGLLGGQSHGMLRSKSLHSMTDKMQESPESGFPFHHYLGSGSSTRGGSGSGSGGSASAFATPSSDPLRRSSESSVGFGLSPLDRTIYTLSEDSNNRLSTSQSFSSFASAASSKPSAVAPLYPVSSAFEDDMQRLQHEQLRKQQQQQLAAEAGGNNKRRGSGGFRDVRLGGSSNSRARESDNFGDWHENHYLVSRPTRTFSSDRISTPAFTTVASSAGGAGSGAISTPTSRPKIYSNQANYTPVSAIVDKRLEFNSSYAITPPAARYHSGLTDSAAQSSTPVLQNLSVPSSDDSFAQQQQQQQYRAYGGMQITPPSAPAVQHSRLQQQQEGAFYPYHQQQQQQQQYGNQSVAAPSFQSSMRIEAPQDDTNLLPGPQSYAAGYRGAAGFYASQQQQQQFSAEQQRDNHNKYK